MNFIVASFDKYSSITVVSCVCVTVHMSAYLRCWYFLSMTASIPLYCSRFLFPNQCVKVHRYLFAFTVVTFDGKLRVALYYNVHVSVPLRHCASVQSSLGLTDSLICTCGGL